MRNSMTTVIVSLAGRTSGVKEGERTDGTIGLELACAHMSKDFLEWHELRVRESITM